MKDPEATFTVGRCPGSSARYMNFLIYIPTNSVLVGWEYPTKRDREIAYDEMFDKLDPDIEIRAGSMCGGRQDGN